MKISKQIGDKAIIGELGERLTRTRLERNLTQAELAEQSGVSKRTLERIEAGGAAQLDSLIRLCRALDLLERLDALIPEPTPSPIAQLKLRGKERQRASSFKVSEPAPGKWRWGDEK